MSSERWDIRLEGRTWTGDEAMQRYALAPKNLEMVKGKLLSSDEARLALLGLLLENVGASQAVRLGDPSIWRDAVASIRRPPNGARVLVLATFSCVLLFLITLLWLMVRHDPAGVRFFLRWSPALSLGWILSVVAVVLEIGIWREDRASRGPNSGT